LNVRALNADVWKSKIYAYVGNWGSADRATGNDCFCPSPTEKTVSEQ
jgi:hypothetical protein